MATYYVATDGNDSYNTTQAQVITTPWASWQKAADEALAGDTVYFRGGVYTPTHGPGGVRDFNTGTLGNPITFEAYPADWAAGNYPILDCAANDTTGISYNKGMSIAVGGGVGCEYMIFKGLHVRNVYQGHNDVNCVGIGLSRGGHVTFENCVVYNVEGECFTLSDYYGVNRYINCDAYNCNDALRTLFTAGQNGAGFQASSDGIDFDNGSATSELYYYGCRSWEFSDNGFAGESIGYVEWDRCWAWDGGELGGGGCGWKYSSTYYDGVHDTDNYLDLARTIKNCIASDCGEYGFSTNNSGDRPMNIHFYNNFAYRCGYREKTFGYGIVLNRNDTTAVPNTEYKNNISYDNENGTIYLGTPADHGTIEYNSWDTPPGVTLSDADFVSVDDSQLAGTRKADFSLPDITFGTLVEGSDLIGAGINVGLTTDGAGELYNDPPSLGAFEYVDDELMFVSVNTGLASYSIAETPVSSTQIIADHTVVADFDLIPAAYLAEVKKALICFPGQSHSLPSKHGPRLLSDQWDAANPGDTGKYRAYAPSVAPAYNETELRVNDDPIGAHDEDGVAGTSSRDVYVWDWWTWRAWDAGSEPANESVTVKNWLSQYNAAGIPFTALGYGWCVEMYSSYWVAGIDPVTNNNWWGNAPGGPDGRYLKGTAYNTDAWGIDAGDYTLTNVTTNLGHYFEAMEEYITYCSDNSIPTEMIFSTAPQQLDYASGGNTETLYVCQLKNDAIRAYVAQDETRILYDFMDIIAHDDGTEAETTGTHTYDGETYEYQLITPTNEGTKWLGHMDSPAAIRLAKAQWWMLARIAGWNGIDTD